MFGALRLGYFAIFGVAAILLGAALAISERPAWYYLDFVASRSVLSISLLPPMIWVAWVGILVTKRRLERPTIAIYRLARRNRHWLLRGAVFTALAIPLARAFSSLKRAIPDLVPFYADPAFIYADRLLFFGIDPWRITHSVFGPISTLVIDRLYLLWFPIMLGLNAWYNFTRDQRLQVRGILSFILTWAILGNAAAIGLSSVGPCFYELFYGDPEFRPLLDTLRGYHDIYGIKAFSAMNWLYENRDIDRFGSGISAMPSLHVAIAFLLFLTVKHATRSRWLVGMAAAYVLVIWVGSIHLGWHYAVDGPVSVIGVAVIWWATGRFVAWLDRQGEPAAARYPEANADVRLPPQAEAA